jgi:hypothetical protein
MKKKNPDTKTPQKTANDPIGEKVSQRGAVPTDKKQPSRDVVGRDRVDVTSDDSFPASDPPAWTQGHEKPVEPVTRRTPPPGQRRKG